MPDFAALKGGHAPPALALNAIGQVVEIRVNVGWLVAQSARQELFERGTCRVKFVVPAGHALPQRLRLRDHDLHELARSQAQRSVPAAIGGLNADSDQEAVHAAPAPSSVFKRIKAIPFLEPHRAPWPSKDEKTPDTP